MKLITGNFFFQVIHLTWSPGVKSKQTLADDNRSVRRVANYIKRSIAASPFLLFVVFDQDILDSFFYAGFLGIYTEKYFSKNRNGEVLKCLFYWRVWFEKRCKAMGHCPPPPHAVFSAISEINAAKNVI